MKNSDNCYCWKFIYWIGKQTKTNKKINNDIQKLLYTFNIYPPNPASVQLWLKSCEDTKSVLWKWIFCCKTSAGAASERGHDQTSPIYNPQL